MLTDSHPLFVYFTGNLAHTKGKGINTMRSPRTPTRTITFAKVLTALCALSLYYPPHQELPLKSCSIYFFSFCSHYYSQNPLLNYNSASLASTVFFISTLSLLPNYNYSFSYSYLFCLLFSSSLCLCISITKDGSANFIQFFFFQ